ncbi:hypothetical protein JIG36_44925 [Actinoplanes sp. LDG1-06]|uniref:SWIM-type domain-containing protein n=2 Tax=Paractinoplanes ovalisporus TaxID=2810368 RepID=A0ABS2AS10_9ACTN|nr:hypothetical protein [Actinoplanes ovalisporus]
MGPTFARGRRDERAGHVRSLTISSSLVVAQVRGPDDPRAFRSRIAVRAFGASEWAAVSSALAGEARFVAQLLDGRMPGGIGEVFSSAGLSLVPLSLDEVAMDCTCERWPMPCVHLAATCYALARSFQEDPFGAFAWRGRGRDELLTHLRELRGAIAVTRDNPGSASRGASASRAASSGPASSSVSPDAASSTSAGAGFSAPAGAAFGGATSTSSAGSSAPGGPSSSHPAEPPFSDPAGPPFSDSPEADLGESLGEVADFWGSSLPAAVPTGARPGGVTRPDTLLDQLDPPPLAEGGRPIVDVLRPAYLALPS